MTSKVEPKEPGRRSECTDTVMRVIRLIEHDDKIAAYLAAGLGGISKEALYGLDAITEFAEQHDLMRRLRAWARKYNRKSERKTPMTTAGAVGSAMFRSISAGHTLPITQGLGHDLPTGALGCEETLGSLYQYLSYGEARSMRKASVAPRNPEELSARNRYFTPRWVAEWLAIEALPLTIKGEYHTDPRKIRVVDPACGCGALLLAVFDRLVAHYIRAYQGGMFGRIDENTFWMRVPEWILSNIYGCDIDPHCVTITRLALVIKAYRLREYQSVSCGNKLKTSPNNIMHISDTLGVLSDEHPWRKLKWTAVVMNPPFGAFAACDKAYAKRQYPESHKDIMTAFMDAGLRMLAPGRKLGALTSRTWCFLTSAAKFRKMILDQHKFQMWLDLGYGILDDAMVEVGAYIIEAGGAP